MSFVEPLFLFVFLPLVFAAYWIVPQAWSNGVLVAASYLFYAAGEPAFLPWLLAAVAANHGIVGALTRVYDHWLRPCLLVVGITGNLALLGWFKYGTLVLELVGDLWPNILGNSFSLPEIGLPLGISFFTFQSISYLIDVYRGSVPPQGRFFGTALYIGLFPQLIAGPIVRYHEIRDQLWQRAKEYEDVLVGIRRFIMGLGKKVLLANTFAWPADEAFAASAMEGLSAGAAWFAIVCFALQIYFDFSGYSDMALGLGRMFGFRLPENFNYPYAATSFTTFWRRWHITLSHWFRDYLYIPLGGNRRSSVRTFFNLVVVFSLCGLWHGANWSFLWWGWLHGFLLIVERLWVGYRVERGRLLRCLQRMVFLVVLLITWVSFRADSAGEALTYYRQMLALEQRHDEVLILGDLLNRELGFHLLLGCLIAGGLFKGGLTVFGADSPSTRGVIDQVRGYQDWWWALVLVLSMAQVATATYSPFIYFRF